MLTNDELDGFGLTQMVASLLHHILVSMSGMIQVETTGQSNLQPTGWSNIENKKAPPTGRTFELAQRKRSQRLRMSSNRIVSSSKMYFKSGLLYAPYSPNNLMCFSSSVSFIGASTKSTINP